MTTNRLTPFLTKKERFLRALQFQPVDRPPVWLMRQAGRYMPEYQAVRKNHTFLEMCRKPEVAAEVSIQPLEILDVDAIIIFNDILIPIETMGREVVFTEKGPVITPPFRNESELKSLCVCAYDETPPVYDSIQCVRRQVGESVPILGFAGAPFTMATYFVEGEMTRNLNHIKTLMYSQPDVLKKLLDIITETVIAYLQVQIKAGADAVQIFDTWAGSLTQTDYRVFAYPYQKRIIHAIQSQGTPIILYVNGSSPYLSEMKQTGASVLSVDWRHDLKAVQKVVGSDTVLQGNLDPTVLFAGPEIVSQKTQIMLETMGRKEGYIANLGHGILPETPVESVKAFVQTVQQAGQ
ncbi:MAG: uroporphyrinogen decarboxylase [bacterium]|jgi:uroporphyrinogen decarboxylase|nr:uroporphyrinogen decarboxylase [bacterium]